MASYRGIEKAMKRIHNFQINNLIDFWNKRKSGIIRDQKIF